MYKDFLLSVIIPVYNEQGNIKALLDRLLPVLSSIRYEIIFINDGSNDKTDDEIRVFAKHNKNIKLLTFTRNFGHQMALMCGYHTAKGNCVVSMDADLQDPPELIREMIEKWQNGAQVVYAKRNKREVDSLFKKFTASLFYSFVNFLSDTPIPQDVGDYRLLDRKVVNFLNNLPEQSRFLRGLVAWGGYSAEYVFFEREKRHTGTTHYTVAKMLNFALEGITTFSTKPLRIASYLGFISASLGFLGIIYTILEKLFFPSHLVTGWSALFIGTMFLGGVQLLTIGIIGEYISKIYHEVQKRPQYLIKETINL